MWPETKPSEPVNFGIINSGGERLTILEMTQLYFYSEDLFQTPGLGWVLYLVVGVDVQTVWRFEEHFNVVQMSVIMSI